MARLARDRPPAQADPQMPLVQAWGRWRLTLDAAGASPATLRTYGAALKSFAAVTGNPPLPALTPDDARRFLVRLRDDGRSANTRQTYYAALAVFAGWCVRERLSPASFMAGVARPHAPETEPAGFSPAEVNRLLGVCNTRTPYGARDAAIVLTLAATGLRAAECCRLRRGDVVADLDAPAIRVLGKGRRERLVALQRPARDAIGRYLALRGEDDDPALWLGQQGALTPSGLRSLCAKLGTRANVAHCHPHRFRNTALALMLDAGINQIDVARLSGHRQMQMLDHYVRFSAARRANATLLEVSPLERAGIGLGTKRRR